MVDMREGDEELGGNLGPLQGDICGSRTHPRHIPRIVFSPQLSIVEGAKGKQRAEFGKKSLLQNLTLDKLRVPPKLASD